jgi:hypothetical protein
VKIHSGFFVPLPPLKAEALHGSCQSDGQSRSKDKSEERFSHLSGRLRSILAKQASLIYRYGDPQGSKTSEAPGRSLHNTYKQLITVYMQTLMSNYMQEADAWLTAVLLGGEDGETEEQWFTRVKKQIKDKLLESYRNGLKAGRAKSSATAKPYPHPSR